MCMCTWQMWSFKSIKLHSKSRFSAQTLNAHSHCSFWEQARCGDQNRLLRFSSRAVVNPLDPFKATAIPMYLNRIFILSPKWAQPSQLASLQCLICIWFNNTFYTWHLGVMINDQNVFLKFLNESGYTSTMSKYFNEFVIFTLGASFLYIVNSSAQLETPIPLNFIEQLNKNELSSKRKTKPKAWAQRIVLWALLWLHARMPGCIWSPPYSTGVGNPFSTRVSHKELTTGDVLISCGACIIAADSVCLQRQTCIIKHSMCPKPDLLREKSMVKMLNDFLASPLRLPEELSAFPIR